MTRSGLIKIEGTEQRIYRVANVTHLLIHTIYITKLSCTTHYLQQTYWYQTKIHHDWKHCNLCSRKAISLLLKKWHHNRVLFDWLGLEKLIVTLCIILSSFFFHNFILESYWIVAPGNANSFNYILSIIE